MKDYSGIEDLSEMMKAIMTDFKSELEAKLLADLERRKIKNTGATIQSLKMFVEEGVVSSLKLNFMNAGRFQDIRNKPTDKINIDALAEWVKSVGINKFKLKGVDSLDSLKNPENRIAFAIASKKQKLGRWKTRRWYGNNIYKMVFSTDGLVENLLSNLTDNMIKELTQYNSNGNS